MPLKVPARPQRADPDKDTCSPCRNGRHDDCTSPNTCKCNICHPPVVVWEEPPPIQRGRGRGGSAPTAEQINELRAHPGRWARIFTWQSKSSAGSCAKRCAKQFPLFEWVGRTKSGDRTSTLYGRYTGKADESDASNNGQ